MTILTMPLKRPFWRHFKSIGLKYKHYFINILFQLKTDFRYSIYQIDDNRRRLVISEYGMTFYLSFDELHQHLNMISQMSQHDVLVFGFLLSRHGSIDNLKLERSENIEQDLSFILESEDRIGRYKIYDLGSHCVQTVTLAELIQNKSMMKRMSHSDLLQIGLSAGKNRAREGYLAALKKSLLNHYPDDFVF